MLREKYTRSELLVLLDKYESIVKEIERIKLNLRETTFEINAKAKLENLKNKDKLVE